MTLLCVQGGTVYDPANGVDGEVRDVWIENGSIVAPPVDPQRRADKTLDATGLVVMPGGIDMHCHIVGPKVNAARKLMSDEKRISEPVHRTATTRSGTQGSVPSSFATGYLYAGLGYTTAFDAAIPALAARHAHEELQDTPFIDKGFFVLMGNNHYLLEQVRDRSPERLKAYLGWLMNAAKGYAAKIVNPGGIEVWKATGGNATGIDEPIAYFGVTPRQIVASIAQAVDELGLPHPVHVHCNNLGMPGNWTTTLETMKALEGRRGHLTHIQFHSYGGDPDAQSSFSSEVPKLAEYVNSHRNLTVDVGQVLFGKTTSMTADSPLGYFLHKVTGHRWFNADIEMETGCGIVPIEYKEKNLISALQWACGLEWYLLVDDPWRIAMSTDHPNGGSFLAYPEIIALLMDRSRRRDVLAQLPQRVTERCTLADLDREYSLYEITIITRAAPARMLGLDRKGQLGVGADADLTLYQPDRDLKRMFELPRYVIHRGEIIVDGGEVRSGNDGRLLHVAPEYDTSTMPHIREWFDRLYSLQFRNYGIDESELREHEVIATRP